MTAKRVVVLLVAALVAYFLLIGYFGIYLLGQSGIGLKLLGGAVLAFPLIGVWIVVVELRFGAATARLGATLDAEGEPVDDELPRTASGRPERAAADALFESRRSEVEAQPDDWRRWYRLAVAYDLAGDRRRARAAMRTAIELAPHAG
ncbi:MAG TPA: hypothetical protein VJ831_00960 [Jatrophihabitantaceae bacterium]|nr:hypothetical protein [Jatrophihabitantaceae bacterium]